MADEINHPLHYITGKIEVIDFIEDQKLGYHDGNVVKYICRFKHKGTPIKDLKKARWYLDRLIKNMEEGKIGKRGTVNKDFRKAVNNERREGTKGRGK